MGKPAGDLCNKSGGGFGLSAPAQISLHDPRQPPVQRVDAVSQMGGGVDGLAQCGGILDEMKAAARDHVLCGEVEHISGPADAAQQGSHGGALPDGEGGGGEFGQKFAVHGIKSGGEVGEDQGLGGEIGAAGGIGADQAVGQIADRRKMQVGMWLGGEQNGEILRAADQIGAHLGGIIGFDVEGGFGQGAAKLGDPGADMMYGEIVLDTEADGLTRVVADMPARLVPFMAQGAGVGLKTLTFGGEVGSGAGAGEEAGIEGGFEGLDAARDGGLGQAHSFGGAVEAAGFDEIEEGVEKFDLHGGTLIGVSDQ